MTLPLPTKQNILAHILAGGRARRMQGEDKGLIELHGKPLLRHVMERLDNQVSTLCISANRHLEQYQQFGCPVITDHLAGFLGPLAGIHAALQSHKAEWYLTVPVDCPFLPGDLVMRLSQAITTTQRPLAVVHDGIDLQPTFCLLHQSLAESLQDYLQAGGRKTSEWLRLQNPALVDYSDNPKAFTNINTLDDLEEAEQQLQHAD